LLLLLLRLLPKPVYPHSNCELQCPTVLYPPPPPPVPRPPVPLKTTSTIQYAVPLLPYLKLLCPCCFSLYRLPQCLHQPVHGALVGLGQIWRRLREARQLLLQI